MTATVLRFNAFSLALTLWQSECEGNVPAWRWCEKYLNIILLSGVDHLGRLILALMGVLNGEDSGVDFCDSLVGVVNESMGGTGGDEVRMCGGDGVRMCGGDGVRMCGGVDGGYVFFVGVVSDNVHVEGPYWDGGRVGVGSTGPVS